MAPSKSLAAETCRRLAMHYQGLLEAAELLEGGAMTESQLVTAKHQAEVARTELAQLQTELAKAKRIVKETEGEITVMLRQADEQATEKLKAADKRAAEILQQAKEDAARAARESQQRVQLKLEDLAKKIAETESALTALQLRADGAAREARTFEEKARTAKTMLEQIQTQARKMAGAE